MVATSERKRIAHKRPPVGTTWTANYKERSYTAQIVEVKEFSAGWGVQYRRQLFSSPSAAAEAITGYKTNGWTFWHSSQTSGRRPHPRPSN